MTVTVTSRHFKAHESLVSFAQSSVRKLEHYYAGILKGEVILHFEKDRKSVKFATIKIGVNRTLLTSEGKSEEFEKSIEIAVEKLSVRLKKYKERLRSKNKSKIREVKQKI